MLEPYANESVSLSPQPTVAHEYIEALLKFHPHVAIRAGLHAYDGRVADWSDSAIVGRIRELREFVTRLQYAATAPLAITVPIRGTITLSPDATAAWDARLAYIEAQAELFEWESLKAYTHDPLIYASHVDISTYIKRPYAPLPDRINKLVAHLAHIPYVLQTARHHLQSPVQKIIRDQSIATYRSLELFHTNELPAFIHTLTDARLIAAFHRVNNATVLAYHDFLSFLRAMPITANEEPQLSEALLLRSLAITEGITTSSTELLQLGLADLERNRARLADVAHRLGKTPIVALHDMGLRHPPVRLMLETTRTLLHELREFLIHADIVTVPIANNCQVRESYGFMRAGSAFIDTPGPFEEHDYNAYFYLTLPDPQWSLVQQEAWMAKQSIPGLANTAIHEGLPGHFLQYHHHIAAPTMASKLFSCVSFTEGWAHYAEQLMVDQGYQHQDPHFELHQTMMALLRDCRLIVTVLLHNRQMSLDEATQFIAKETHFPLVRAQQEAMRGLRDPAYLNYTLGKLTLQQLIANIRTAHPQLSLRAMHDTLLAFGSPPIPLLREALLGT